jgi:hypothetical protein
MNLGVAAVWQSAAVIREESLRRSAETPLRGYGSWSAGSLAAEAGNGGRLEAEG